MLVFKKKEITAEDVEEMLQNLKKQTYKVSLFPVCDFCGNSRPVFMYASRRMSTGFNINCWRWSACKDCDAIITANHWITLKNKIIQRLEPMQYIYGQAALRSAVEVTMNSFLTDALIETNGF